MYPSRASEHSRRQLEDEAVVTTDCAYLELVHSIYEIISCDTGKFLNTTLYQETFEALDATSHQWLEVRLQYATKCRSIDQVH